ncbi:MAG: hypothetical protein HJJLKODD_03023 [Phycisphaerae bacterium]|nr:hypothetical protein [Phycisphaerae bacterium]
MFDLLAEIPNILLGQSILADRLSTIWSILLVLIGFSVVIFFHELGHFAVAKWAGVRVERFAIGFGPEIVGYSYGETRYSINILPLGGYVKMLGQDDFDVDSTGDIKAKGDPRSFINKPVGARMAIVSAGVVMNLIIAALGFMVLYMIGREETKPIIGEVVLDSPAARSGILVGDEILRINDAEINNFNQISMAVVLADPLEPLDVEVMRDQRSEIVRVRPEVAEDNDLLRLGVRPAMTTKILSVDQSYLQGPGPYLQRNDMAVEVNGTPVGPEEGQRMMNLLLQGRNQPSTLKVQRNDPRNPSATPQQLQFQVPKQIAFFPSEIRGDSPRDFLGMMPRVRVTDVITNSAAAQAGLQDGDVIIQWGNLRHPNVAKLAEEARKHVGRDMPVRIRRQSREQPQPLYYRPVATRDDKGKVNIKLGFTSGMIEQDEIVLSGVIGNLSELPAPAGLPGWLSEVWWQPVVTIWKTPLDPVRPAALTPLQRGCRIVSLNGDAVAGWADFVERCRQLAGATGADVTLGYYADGQSEPQSTTLHVPACISTILDLPAFSPSLQTINFTLDDQANIEVFMGTQSSLLPATVPYAIRTYLNGKIGQSVKVTFQDDTGQLTTRHIMVTADMVDPWYRRVAYMIPPLTSEPVSYLNRKINPIAAITAGVQETYYSVAKAYLTFKRMIFTRSVGVEKMSGPLGIIQAGSEMAKYDKLAMLYFLAFLSANLAVINFLPLPVVDGGLMVFLIIEWIKGSPVSLRTQVITQMVGLALIAVTFLFVTYQDLARMLG